jgi:uncharacterized protein with ParB-like and HNH nuclease domain/predicted HicB family RNase H-like nuclease
MNRLDVLRKIKKLGIQNMARLENNKYTIEEAFRECFYIVPDYQREYVWTEKQITQLLEDIDEQMDRSSSEYFIGNILVSSQAGERNHYEVIDGQQRLTTTFLILCVLQTLFKNMEQGHTINGLIATSYTAQNGETKTNRKLEPRYENSDEVIKKIVEAKDDPQTVRALIQSSGIPIYGSVENLLNAYDVIYRFLNNNYENESKLIKYWGHLANNVVFIQISADISSVLKIFETINERGVGLNPMDLLKNLLFTEVEPEDFSRLKGEWKNITRPLEKHKEKPLRFLRYFLMANYDVKNERKDSVVREDEIYDWISKKENAARTGYREDPFEFIRKIKRNVTSYIDFKDGLGNDGKASLAMNSLKRLTGAGFSLHYILLLAAAGLPKSLFDQFVAQLESFLFFFIFTKSPTKELERNFSLWADKIRDIAKLNTPEKQQESLNKFISEHFAKRMEDKQTELEDALNRLTLHSMQQYRIHYLLARLTQHVDMAYRGEKVRENLDIYFKLEIEHILPNNPKDDLRNAWEQEQPSLNYDDYKNFLGNLTLLEKPINIVAGNNFYKDKMPEYKKSGNYLTRSLSGLVDVGKNTTTSRINQKLSASDTWQAQDIKNRQQQLIDLAFEICKTTEISS